MGSYPSTGPKDARAARDAAKAQKTEGNDPIKARKVAKLMTDTTDQTFKAMALEWFELQRPNWSESYAVRHRRNLEKDLFPYVGALPMTEIHPMQVLTAVQAVEKRGSLEAARRVLDTASQVFKHWLPMASPQYRGTAGTAATPDGPREVRFPGERSHDRPLSDNSVRSALYAMGFGSEQSWHGFRASARTMMVDELDADPLAIEANLAHAVKDSNGRSYNRIQYLKKRFDQIQLWADYLDRLRDGAPVIDLNAHRAA